MGDRDFVDLLRPHLEHDNKHMRRTTIQAILKIGAAGVEAEMIDAIDNAGWRNFITMQYIARVRGERARNRVTESVRDHFEHGMPSRDASNRHVENLGRFDDPEVVDELLLFLDHDDQGVRRRAIEALGRIGHDSATPKLLEALADPMNGELRHYAVVALERIGDQRAETALVELLDDQSYSVRILAAWALRTVGRADGEGTVAALTDALGDPHWLIRATSAETLGALGAAAASKPLIETLGDVNSDVRIAAAKSLASLGAREAVEPLVGCLADWSVGPSAAAALDELGWRPGDDPTARARYLVAKRDGAGLADRWSHTRAVLLNDLQSDGPTALNAAYSLLGWGDAEAVSEIAAMLERTDRPAVAARAREWAAAHDYRLQRQRAASPVRWGALRK